MEQRKTRLLLLLCVSITMLAMLVFLWAIDLNQPEALRAVLNRYLSIAGGFALLSLAIFFLKGKIFNEQGRLERGRVLTMTMIVIVVAQLVFAFANYAYRQLNNTFDIFDQAKICYSETEEALCNGSEDIHKSTSEIRATLAEELEKHPQFSAAALTNYEGEVLYSADKNAEGTTIQDDPLHWLTYPLPPVNVYLRLNISEENREARTREILSELLTIMAASVFLMIELMLFALRFITDRSAPPEPAGTEKPLTALRYVRQIAFLFYFASQLCSSFLSVYARNLGGSIFGLSGNVLAAVPQSTETLLTCVAVLFTSMLIEKRGWKMPFLGGLAFVAAGTLGSALAPNIALYIAARAVVGLGYGFCWMTLRNFALFGRNEEEKSEGFSLLNAGLYAGINCGSVLGSILADRLGYEIVFTLSAIFTLLCAAAVARLENAVYVPPTPAETLAKGEIGTRRQWAFFVLFLVLMIAPACISGAYLSYYLPLYFTDTGYSVADVGRAKLLYGVLIIYAGPPLARMLARTKRPWLWNFAYIALIGSAFVLFGFAGGLPVAMCAVLILGFSDSFGFVAQNNYFLALPLVRKLGESKSLSVLSLIKKLLEMTGPLVFGFAFAGGATGGVLIIGVVCVAAALCFLASLRLNRAEKTEN